MHDEQVQCWVIHSDCHQIFKGKQLFGGGGPGQDFERERWKGNRKVLKEKGAAHEDSFEAGVSISTWGDRCAGR